MSDTTALNAFGSDIQYADTADYATANTWTSAGCVIRVTPPGQTVNNIEVPPCVNADTPVVGNKPGSIRVGTVTYETYYAPGDIDDALALLRVMKGWRIALGETGQYVAFNGYMASHQFGELNADGLQQVMITVQPDGDLDELASSSF